jgi:hypothetical protein
VKRLLLGCLLAGAALRMEAAEPGEFRFSKDIERGTPTQESIVAVALDSDVCAATRAGFPDLRVFDGDGQETPYLMEKVVETRPYITRTACQSRVVSLREHDGGIEVVVELAHDAPSADGLTIVTPLTNYERRVRVLGGRDGADKAAYAPLVNDGLVFDYSRYMDVSNREIRLPKNQARRFEIQFADIVDSKQSPLVQWTRKYRGGSETERIEQTVLERRPFRIDRIDVWHEVSQNVSESARTVAYPVAKFRTEEDAAAKTTIVHVQTRCEPLTEFTLETTSRNFSRSATVQAPVVHGIQKEWVSVAQGQVALLAIGDYRKETLGISLPEHRQHEYRIVIRNEDNPPLTITGVKARGNVYRVVFLAGENTAYCLCYGSEQVEPPAYDSVAVLAPLRQGHVTNEARLGQETRNAAPSGTFQFTLRGVLNNPAVLGGLIVLLVAGLGWALFHAVRRINKLPKE